MRNRYEFNIDKINVVMIESKSEGFYTNVYMRKIDEHGKRTRKFVRTFHAEPDDSVGNGNILILCNRCESWNEVSKDKLDDPDYEFKCKHCTEDYEDIITEEELINAINGAMDPDVYFDIKLIINNIIIE